MTEQGWPIAPKDVVNKFVTECGALVRDKVPIKIREWKGKTDDPYALPQAQKDMLWQDVKRHFTFPDDVDDNLVKGWTLSKMATQFQTFKKNFNVDFIKKGKTPNFNEWPKLRAHWDAFVEYKMSEHHRNKSAQCKSSASMKQYNHRLGSGGYLAAIPKWKKMEKDLLARGIIPATYEWPDRSKNWYYAHGGSLHPEDGSLIFNQIIREKALQILKNIEDVKSGKLKVDRENDELTLALGNPEHSGHCRGFGVLSWKFAFKGDVGSYRSRKRKKDREEERWRNMIESQIREQSEKMQEEVDRRVIARFNEMVHSEALPDANIIGSPSQRRSSCASTGVGEDNIPIQPVDENQVYPVDEICQRAQCELHKQLGDITVKVHKMFPLNELLS